MYRFLISGYNQGPEDCGIRAYNFDDASQTLKVLGEATGMASPSYCITTGALGNHLYAACETPDQGGLAHCQLDSSGIPKLVDQVHFTHAAGTTFVMIHPSGKHLFGADYNSGSVSCSEVDAEGHLHEPVKIYQHGGHGFPRPAGYINHDRQLIPHVHTLSMVPGTSLLAAVDLGLDLIVLYETDDQGNIVDAPEPTVLCPWPDDLPPQADSYAMSEAVPKTYAEPEMSYLEELGETTPRVRLTRKLPAARSECIAELPVRPAAIVEAPPCVGPRIVAYHPSKPLVAVVCELSCEVILYQISSDGKAWEARKRIDLLKDVSDPLIGGEAPRGAQCAFTSDERFMYAATRGVDIMTTFAIDDDCNVISRSDCPSGGKTPRLFAMSPDEKLIAVTNHDSNNVQLFERDAQTGTLNPTLSIDYNTPSCVVWE